MCSTFCTTHQQQKGPGNKKARQGIFSTLRIQKEQMAELSFEADCGMKHKAALRFILIFFLVFIVVVVFAALLTGALFRGKELQQIRGA